MIAISARPRIRRDIFISGSRMGRGHVIAFKHLTQLPAGNDVGDATIFLNTADDDLGHELAIAADEHFAVFDNILVITDTENHEIPFGIHHEDLAVQTSRFSDNGVRANYFSQLCLDLGQLTTEQSFFTIDGSDFGVGVFQLLVEREDLIRGQTSSLVSRQRVLGVIAFLGGLGEFIGKIVSAFLLGVGAGDGLAQIALGIGEFLLGLGKIALSFLERTLGGRQLGERGVLGFIFLVTLANERRNLIGNFVIGKTTGAESGENGHD